MNAGNAQTRKAVTRRPRPAATFTNITAADHRASADEYALHCAIVDLIKLTRVPELVFYHVPNGGIRHIGTAKKLKRMGTMPGVSDLGFVLPGGQAAFLEIKTDGGPLSDDQKDFRFAAIKAGAKFGEARNVDQAINLLSAWGAIRVQPARTV